MRFEVDDYQKATVRIWAVEAAISANKGKKITTAKVLSDARLINNYLTDATPAPVLAHTKDTKAK